MGDSRIVSINSRKRRKEKRIILVFLFCLVFLLGVLLGFGIVTTKASASDTIEGRQAYKYFTSVFVEPGDSLWNIAERFMTDEYEDKQTYISEVMQINHMSDEKVNAGAYICVPYYSHEVK